MLQVLHSIKAWGATGILLEWEDTFPYSANLAHLGSMNNTGGDGLYSLAEVQRIFDICKALGLEVIQLVQTIGHMEFVLKHPCHEHLREYHRSPAVICPMNPEARQLVKEMLLQVLSVQPEASYFHIGADEVWHMGVCDDCKNKVCVSPQDVWRLYLEHIRDLAMFIKQQRPDVTVLMWDDMLRPMTPDVLEAFNLKQYVQPVVWNYEEKENFAFGNGMWEMYKRFFPTVWAGSSYKGANGSCALVAPVKRYVSNHEAWIAEMGKVSSDINFVGIILTGWSRYDHFATLCELLPTSLNSLANCLKSLAGPVESFEELCREKSLREEQWPGVNVHTYATALASIRERYYRLAYGDLITTWMNDWQLESGFLNMFQVESIGNSSNLLSKELKTVETAVTSELNTMFGHRSATEWLRTFLTPLYEGLTQLQRTVQRVKSQEIRCNWTPSVA
ncbi:hexosaminidase D-like isoform X2 [Epargyreus clarus]|uniref:hexosaminidase D-like isoform X2 n=1 Tax=Epargyreus clarus TaxID=520877 RepID=UPI003C2EA212